MRLTTTLTATAVALFPLLATGAEIGSVAAVNRQVDGTPPGAAVRVLELSDALYLDETIRSSEVGNAQFLFQDQTSLSIAPKTELVLDRYVYDPEQQTGEMVLGMTRGVLRFVGGRISKTTDVRVVTPVATVGIRGGLVIIELIDGVLRVVQVAGEYTWVEEPDNPELAVRPDFKWDRLTVSRPSALVEVRPGQAAEYMGVVSDEVVRRLYGGLRGPGGGGARGSERIAAAFDYSRVDGQSGGNGSGSQSAGQVVPGGVGTTGAVAGAGSVPVPGSAAAAVAASGETPYLLPQSTAGEQPVGGTEYALVDFGLVGEIDYQTFTGLGGGLGVSAGALPPVVNVGGEGFIRGQLVWSNNADLDLHLLLPEQGGEVAFFNTVVPFNAGGAVAELDADNLGGIVNVAPDLRVENITVTGSDVPAGAYEFFVRNFSDNGNVTTPFNLTVTADGGDTFVRQTGSLEGREDSAPLVVESAGGAFLGN